MKIVNDNVMLNAPYSLETIHPLDKIITLEAAIEKCPKCSCDEFVLYQVINKDSFQPYSKLRCNVCGIEFKGSNDDMLIRNYNDLCDFYKEEEIVLEPIRFLTNSTRRSLRSKRRALYV